MFEPRLTESLAGRAAFVDLWPLSQGEIGGMPAAINFDERDRRDFHRDYIRAMASRDVAELGRIPSTIDLTDLMRLLAARTAHEASQATLGIAGVEVKAALDFSSTDFRGLRLMRDRLDDRFRTGVLLHCGDRVQRVEDRLIAMPISALWASPA